MKGGRGEARRKEGWKNKDGEDEWKNLEDKRNYKVRKRIRLPKKNSPHTECAEENEARGRKRG